MRERAKGWTLGRFFMSISPKAPQQPKPREASAQQLSPQESDRLALGQHLSALVRADPKEANAAMRSSQEHLPEMFLIAQSCPVSQFAQALLNSDSMHSLLSRDPGRIKELLQASDLRSLLEMLG